RTVTRGGHTTTFAYDAFGQRVKATNGSTITYTIGGLYEQRSTGRTITHLHHVTSADGHRAQIVTGPPNTAALHYTLTDRLCSLTTTLNARGSSTASFYFAPYGQRIDADGTPLTGPTADTPYGFTGHEHDDQLGLINMKGRLYDPSHTRFITPDPIVSDSL